MNIGRGGVDTLLSSGLEDGDGGAEGDADGCVRVLVPV